MRNRLVTKREPTRVGFIFKSFDIRDLSKTEDFSNLEIVVSLRENLISKVSKMTPKVDSLCDLALVPAIPDTS